mgnify:CR=1 FL=1
METVVSGIRPTGNLHLGNYFGAVKGFLQMQNDTLKLLIYTIAIAIVHICNFSVKYFMDIC